ncbi:unnamed protein product [Ectocarpus sp. 6 AP-2014]
MYIYKNCLCFPFTSCLNYRNMGDGCEDLHDLFLDIDSGCDFGLASLGDLDTPEAFGTRAEDTAVPGPFSDVFDMIDGGGAAARQPSSLAVTGGSRAAGSRAAGSSGTAGSSGAVEAPGVVAAPGAAAAAHGGQLVANTPSSLVAAGLGAAGGGAGGDNRASSSSSSSGGFSDDDTEKDVVHTSDGNMSASDSGFNSIIGSIDGEGSDTSSSSCISSSDSSSSSSDDVSEMSIVSCQGQEDDEDPCMDKPIGLMLAMPDPDDAEGDFTCGKVRQKYEKAGDTPGKKSEVFEVVFKDGSKKEYGREEVLLYKQTYDENEGERGCFEFFFKV